MDLVEFRLIRPPAIPDAGSIVRLTAARTLVSYGVNRNWYDALLNSSRDNAQRNITADQLVAEGIGSNGEDPLDASDGQGSTALRYTYASLTLIDGGLRQANDRVDGASLYKVAQALSERIATNNIDLQQLLGIPIDESTPFQLALVGLWNSLQDGMTKADRNYARIAQLTRLALVCNVFDRSPAALSALRPDQVFGLVNRCSLVMDGLDAETIAPDAKNNLIRDAKKADLQVVRHEWAGYIAGEIANIRNLMAGESITQWDKTTQESETTTTTESSETRQTETEDTSKLNSDLSKEVTNQLGVVVNGHVEASAQFKYPVVTATVSGGVDATLTMQTSERHAAQIARETISRAVSRVDSMTRENRTRRELMRTEQGFEYALSNAGGGNLHAIYRWVDRIDNYQVFRFPDRFLLEFQIPEPAEFYRWRTHRTALAGSNAPPDWDLKIADIAPDKVIDLAAKYRATNLPSMPEKSVSVVRVLLAEIGTQDLPHDVNAVWNPPKVSKEVDVPIPPNYVAVKVHYSGEGHPIRGKWRFSGAAEAEGMHSAWATVSVGRDSTLFWNGGYHNPGGGNRFKATHGDEQDIGSVSFDQQSDPAYGRALLPIGSDASLSPKPITVDLRLPGAAAGDVVGVGGELLKLALSTVGVATCTVTFQVECERTMRAYAEWQLSVYDALYSAWAQWNREYQASLTRKQLQESSSADQGSSDRNERTIREELKRETIGFLLNESTFAGRNALLPRPVDQATGKVELDFANIDFDQVRKDAPTIQFLEQAFEWSNLSYMFYPYYWADRKKWEGLSGIMANDPEFERFLRAGSARVILPARPGFESAVRNWLVYKVPFLNGQLPAPDEDLYVAIDKEIRELTSPWEGGIAGESWQTRISTTMLYLEERGALPFVNEFSQLPAEEGQEFQPKPILAPQP